LARTRSAAWPTPAPTRDRPVPARVAPRYPAARTRTRSRASFASFASLLRLRDRGLLGLAEQSVQLLAAALLGSLHRRAVQLNRLAQPLQEGGEALGLLHLREHLLELSRVRLTAVLRGVLGLLGPRLREFLRRGRRRRKAGRREPAERGGDSLAQI